MVFVCQVTRNAGRWRVWFVCVVEKLSDPLLIAVLVGIKWVCSRAGVVTWEAFGDR